jgi:hypothetical protein
MGGGLIGAEAEAAGFVFAGLAGKDFGRGGSFALTALAVGTRSDGNGSDDGVFAAVSALTRGTGFAAGADTACPPESTGRGSKAPPTTAASITPATVEIAKSLWLFAVPG